MAKTREALPFVSDLSYLDAVAWALEAAEQAAEPVQAGVEAVIAMAELNPEGTRAALWHLQADWPMLRLLEGYVGGGPTRAVLRIGAAIHLARAELASPAPQLRSRLPELMEWLGRQQLQAAD